MYLVFQAFQVVISSDCSAHRRTHVLNKNGLSPNLLHLRPFLYINRCMPHTAISACSSLHQCMCLSPSVHVPLGSTVFSSSDPAFLPRPPHPIFSLAEPKTYLHCGENSKHNLNLHKFKLNLRKFKLNFAKFKLNFEFYLR